ncbi:LysR family transcriptional regulator [Vibrio diazotrophicus]|uniref:LysR family transcriptional regulator n=1 Tax=Vibrio diazotrophicus TaxID=685 RepID=UPI0015E05F7E|nr:LysR family transcriptional regulator [Vibrio diazotrophicus]
MNMNMNIDWNQIKYFIIAAECGSFTAASKMINVSQPTLGRQISSLEENLGVILFERNGNRLNLSNIGKHIYHIAKDVKKPIDKISLAAKENVEELSGLVTVSASQIDAFYRLPKIIKSLSIIAPDIEIKIDVNNSISSLLTHDSDIAITSVRPKNNSLIVRRIGSFPVCLYGGEKYLRESSAMDVKLVNNIGLGDDGIIKTFSIRKDSECYITGCDYSSSFHPLNVELARQGLGLALLPQDVAKNISGLEQVFLDEDVFLNNDIWLVSHSELRTCARVRLVFNHIANEIISE